MAESTLYKLDNGASYPTDCFPIRPLLHQRKEAAGHWLVARGKVMEEKYRKLRSKKSGRRRCARPTVQSDCEKSKSDRKSEITGNILDGPFLISLHCVDKPSDLCSIDISERRLSSAKLEDLEQFGNVVYINASDNYLTLEPFKRFPALRELDLSLNRLHSLDVHAGDLLQLEVLDLSYNNISNEALLSVGLLPSLKVLHLTGNELYALPPNMAAPQAGPDEMAPPDCLLFQSLEVLMLDDNRLSSPGVFLSLAGLRSLQHLNLQQNCISEVPFIELGLSQKVQTSGCTDRGEWSDDFCVPFPELRFLNLADNEIAEEEALMAVAMFPMLDELVIHSNPLTTQRSGDPPMLTYFLQDNLGIKLKRSKTAEPVKPPVMLGVNPRWKVETKISKVSKVPWDFQTLHALPLNEQKPCLERNVEEMSPLPLECQPHDVLDFFSQTSFEEKKRTVNTQEFDTPYGTNTHNLTETYETEKSFFMTEVNGLNESEDHVKSEKTETPGKTVNLETNVYPEKFEDYEVLLDAKNPDILIPVGIQHTVRALEQALKNLLVYKDSKVDHFQQSYVEKEKKTGNLPAVKPRRLKGEKAEEMLTKMKERKTVHEVSLDKVLKRKAVCKKEYEEAMNLLLDMKNKYKMVYSKTVEHATQIETEMTTDQKSK
ncbi:X-ray radiation resistance-associated protein 1 [Chanos chanos]|uniref:X-ray radiation resistance-associated protein 1 n=1 Tax=Chanos chanos TaxID=29144 RepID=A0A6J2W4D3_CHACN|nr:X-ray radiation resistance-associated protein 1 [Chanos chanos]